MTGLVKYDLDTVAVKRKGEMDLSDPEEMPEDAPEPSHSMSRGS